MLANPNPHLEKLHSGPESGTVCAHCGLSCGSPAVRSAERVFCCTGCKTVFEILAENGLGGYYQLEANPGITMTGGKATGFEYLDDPEITEKLVDFRSETVHRTTLHIPSMHCIACLWLLENLFRLESGVGESRVDFPRKRLTVAYDPRVLSLSRLVALLASLGYEPTLSLGDLEGRSKDPAARRLALRIGVAGFSLGNIMLLSFPSYLGLAVASGETYSRLFGWLSLLLAIPVAVYSASDYWRAAWLGVRRRVLTIDFPIALGIAALFGQSLVEIVTASGKGYLDSLAGLVFLLLCGKWFQRRSYDRLSFDRDFKSYFPMAATRISTEGHEESIPLTRVAPGDRLLIRNGEVVPADSVLEQGIAAIDYSFVTGESLPVAREKDQPIYAGGRQVGGAIEISVVREVSQSYLTSLWQDDAFRHKTDPTLDDLTNRVSRWFTALVVCLALGAAAYWALTDPEVAPRAFVSILIVACPCALALSAPFALGTAMTALGRHGFYLRDASVVEKMAGLKTIVFDKTGTLTRTDGGMVRFEGAHLSAKEEAALAAVARSSAHPYARQILGTIEAAPAPLESFAETAGRGMMGRVASPGGGLEVLCGSADWLRGHNVDPPVSEGPSAGTVHVAIGGKYRGRYTVRARYRDDFGPMFRALHKRFRIALTSGDNDRERESLQAIMGERSDLQFEQSPHDKLQLVKSLQSDGPVMMIGDGLNDAGALEASDVGVAVSEDVASFSPACDAILDVEKLPALPAALKTARGALWVVVACFTISFAYNVVGISLAASGMLSPLISAVLMPTSSITVVAFAVGATRLLARRVLGAP